MIPVNYQNKMAYIDIKCELPQNEKCRTDRQVGQMMINDELRRALELFAKRWKLEDELEQLERMLEVCLQMKEARLVGNEQKYLELLDDFSDSYCLSSQEMLLEFKMLLQIN